MKSPPCPCFGDLVMLDHAWAFFKSIPEPPTSRICLSSGSIVVFVSTIFSGGEVCQIVVGEDGVVTIPGLESWELGSIVTDEL